MYKLREDGGIKLIHVQTKSLSSKIKWLTDVIIDSSLAVNKNIIDELIGTKSHGHYGLENLFTYKNYILKLKIASPFYRETIKALASLEPKKRSKI